MWEWKMQEKIHYEIPEIRIVEGKHPTTNWVHQNISRYYRIRAEMEFLIDVITYLQATQSEQLTRGRPKLTLKESYVPIPEKGTAQEVGDAAMYNSAQRYIKIEIECLEGLIALLKQGNPELGKELDGALDQLKQMDKSFPNLSEQQLKNLGKLMEQLTKYVTKVPAAHQKVFWNTTVNMLHTLMMNNEANIKDFQHKANELQARAQMLNTVKGLLQDIKNILNAKPPTQKQFLELVEDLQKLANSSTLLNPQQQQELSNFFQMLGQFKTGKGESLSQFIADGLVQTKMKAFLQENPNATRAQLLNYLTNFLTQSNLQSSPLPFMKSLGNSIENVLNKNGFPACNGFTDIQFATVQGNKIEPNEEMLGLLFASYSPNPESMNQLEQASSGITGAISDETAVHGIEGYHTAINQLQTAQNN